MFTIYDESQWKLILQAHPAPDDAVKEDIWAKTRQFPVPTVEITLKEALEDFRALRDLDSQALVKTGQLFSRYDYKWPIGDKYIDSCNVGNKSSNYFHQELRFKCDSINSPSPYRTWNDKKFFFTLLNGLWSLKFKKVDSGSLRQCIALRKYIASQFRPSCAKAVYGHFNAKKVLDFSSGWGDRLSAAMATDTVQEYVGIDPNSELGPLYTEQIKTYIYESATSEHTKSIRMIALPAEEALSKLNYAPDLVFTSVPYFNIERYSKESTQSWVRYKKLDRWLNEFLFPCLEMSWKLLENDGYMAINVSDVYSGHQINRICDPMNDFISGLSGARKVDNLNYRMAKRLNSKSDEKGIFVEPIWCWRKE